MKFYKNKNNYINEWLDYLDKIKENKLDIIVQHDMNRIKFFKNGKLHNNKNAATINFDNKTKAFFINGEMILYNDFFDKIDKKYWRKYLKLKVFE